PEKISAASALPPASHHCQNSAIAASVPGWSPAPLLSLRLNNPMGRQPTRGRTPPRKRAADDAPPARSREGSALLAAEPREHLVVGGELGVPVARGLAVVAARGALVVPRPGPCDEHREHEHGDLADPPRDRAAAFLVVDRGRPPLATH